MIRALIALVLGLLCLGLGPNFAPAAWAQSGPPPTVRKLRFEVVDPDGVPAVQRVVRAFSGRGNSNLRTAMVQQESNLRSYMPFLRWFGERVTLDQALLDEDALRIELWYAHHGYFDAEFLGWEVETLRPAPVIPQLHFKRFRAPVVRVTGYVREGEPSLIRNVTITGLEGAGRPIQLKVQRSVDDVVGDVFNMDTPYALVALITDLMQQQSYFRVHTELQVDAYPEQHVVDLSIQVVPGPPCRFGEVTVLGLEHVRPELLEEYIHIEPGESFSPQALQDTQSALFNLGTFSVVQLLPGGDPEGDVIPYTLQVSESAFRRFRIGPGLSVQTSEAQVRATTSFTHTNVGGRLINAELSATGGLKAFSTSGNSQAGALIPLLIDRVQGDDGADLGEAASSRYESGPFFILEGSLVWPRFLGIPTLSFSPLVGYKDDLEVGQSFNQLEIAPGFTWRLNKYTTLSPSYHYERWRTELLFQDSNRPQLTESDRNYSLNTLRIQATVDHRDHPIYTRRGYYAQLTLSDSGRWVLPGRTFSAVDLDLRRFAAVQWPVRAVAAGRVAVGLARPYGDDPDQAIVPYNELLFVGGPDTMRGWAQGYFGPRACFKPNATDPELLDQIDCYSVSPDATDVQVFPRGAEAVIYGSLEYRIAGPFSVDYAAFVDVGTFKAELGSDTGSVLRQLQPTVGGGIRYRTPVGPLRVDFGYRLIKPQGQFVLDRRWGLHLSLTEAF